MTWDLQTFQCADNIHHFPKDRIAQSKLKNFKVNFAVYEQPYDDLVWVRVR